MAQRTLYQVLMLDPSATQDVVTAAYRALAKRYHPDHDRSAQAAARMVEINEAYAILRLPTKRALYDEMLGDRNEGHARPTTRSSINTRYENGRWTVRDPAEPMPQAAPYGEAGPPPRHLPATGSVLSFGRYKGWSVKQVAAHDRTYLEWLQRTQAGRTYQRELAEILGVRPS